MKKIIGFGALNVDNIFEVYNLLLEENAAHAADVQAGGSAANTIIGLAKLKIPCGFVGVVTNDAYGKLLLSEFKTRKVDVSKVIVRNSDVLFNTSGLVEAFVDKKGRRLLFVKPGVNSTLKFKEIDFNYLNSSSMIHMSSFVDDEQFEIQKESLKKINPEVKISFSPGSLYCARGLKSLMPFIKRSYIIFVDRFVDRKEIFQLTRKNYKVSAEELLKMGPEIIVVTLGKEGCYIASKNKRISLTPQKTKVKDSTGAGDAFASGFIFGLGKKAPLEICGKLGNAVASFSIARTGARLGLPNRKELASVISLPK